jgi:acyl-CoA synthetase (AMP-forming)/AMP-acid ligase II
MLVPQFLEDSARRSPGAVALIDSSRRTTYGELDALANRYGRLFRQHGLSPGDRVIIAAENGLEMVAAYFAALKAGGVAVPLPAGPRSDRLVHAVIDCTPRIAVIDGATASTAKLASALASVPAVFVTGAESAPSPFTSLAAAAAAVVDVTETVDRSDRDLAAIIYTSGSTGEPRGVMLSHRNFAANTRSIVSYLGLTAVDRVLCVLPFHYVYGLSLLHTHVAVGGSVAIENRSAFPNVVLSAMQEHDVTGFAGVPSTFALMLHRSIVDEVELPRLRYVTQAGGAMPPSQISEWLRRGPKADFFVMYGATEAAARLAYLAPADLPHKLGSIGRAIPGVEITVVTESGERARAGEVGELVAQGENISAGYWNNESETALRFGPLGYRTGDLGYADEDGYLYLVGRQHDMLKVGAHRVGVKEIEDVLHAHPAVFEAAVVGAPHEMLGEAPVAFVALKTAVDDLQNTLRAHCAAQLAAYKVPLRVVQTHELPKLPGAGKLNRTALRAAAADMRFGS